MRVLYASGGLASGHTKRGIGFYNKNLLPELERQCRLLGIELVDRGDPSEGGFDIVHYPYFDLFYNTLKPDGKAKTVVTVYDAIPLIYPDHYPPGVRGKINFIRQKKALAGVDAVTTISETSKKDIVNLLSYPAEKIHVVYCGLGNRLSDKPQTTRAIANIRRKYILPEKYVLYVGDINWNKNISILIQGCEIAQIPLVIVGKQAGELDSFDRKDGKQNRGPRDIIRSLAGKEHPQLAHLIQLRKLTANSKLVRILGYVSEEDHPLIFKGAGVYCQPSLYEGFGMPLLEAFEAQIPLVCAKTQALVEIADDAAIYVDPLSPEAIARSLTRVISDPGLKKRLVNAGKRRIGLYSWERSAKLTADVYNQIGAGD